MLIAGFGASFMIKEPITNSQIFQIGEKNYRKVMKKTNPTIQETEEDKTCNHPPL
jgi:hypothetical protein